MYIKHMINHHPQYITILQYSLKLFTSSISILKYSIMTILQHYVFESGIGCLCSITITIAELPHEAAVGSHDHQVKLAVLKFYKVDSNDKAGPIPPSGRQRDEVAW